MSITKRSPHSPVNDDGETFKVPTLSTRPGTPNNALHAGQNLRATQRSPNTMDELYMRSRRESIRSGILSDYEEDLLRNERIAVKI